MSRHGWVKPLPNGAVARCGGPGMCAHCKAERIVSRLCPIVDGRCYYCRAPLDEGSQGHRPDCIWLPFAEAFS